MEKVETAKTKTEERIRCITLRESIREKKSGDNREHVSSRQLEEGGVEPGEAMTVKQKTENKENIKDVKEDKAFTFSDRKARLQKTEPDCRASGRQQTPRFSVLPEFLLEMYLTSSQTPAAKKTRTTERSNKVFISLLSTGTFNKTGKT